MIDGNKRFYLIADQEALAVAALPIPGDHTGALVPGYWVGA